MEECQAVITRIPLPLPLPWRCSPQRCCRRRCCGVASVGAPHRSGEKQFKYRTRRCEVLHQLNLNAPMLSLTPLWAYLSCVVAFKASPGNVEACVVALVRFFLAWLRDSLASGIHISGCTVFTDQLIN